MSTPAHWVARVANLSHRYRKISALDDITLDIPAGCRVGHRTLIVPRREVETGDTPAIEAAGLSMRFGDFTAVDDVSFRIERGEIFGFLGSNGCGKTTTMKMLTGLLSPSAGRARLFGHPVDPHDLATRKRVGYMTQAFSLYSELSVRQNLLLHARLFHIPADQVEPRVAELVERFDLGAHTDALAASLPLGIRQRLSLAVAMVHKPEMLILDEPTSGVDPGARDRFWELLLDIARNQGVTIFISTHLANSQPGRGLHRLPQTGVRQGDGGNTGRHTSRPCSGNTQASRLPTVTTARRGTPGDPGTLARSNPAYLRPVRFGAAHDPAQLRHDLRRG